MFTLIVKSHFDAAHSLPNYNGACKRQHGHTWIVKAGFMYHRGSIDNDQGMCQDFQVLKNQLQIIVDDLDHYHINKCKHRYLTNPTAENLAMHFYDQIKNMNKRIAWIEIQEGLGGTVRYEP